MKDKCKCSDPDNCNCGANADHITPELKTPLGTGKPQPKSPDVKDIVTDGEPVSDNDEDDDPIGKIFFTHYQSLRKGKKK